MNPTNLLPLNNNQPTTKGESPAGVNPEVSVKTIKPPTADGSNQGEDEVERLVLILQHLPHPFSGR